MRCCAFCHEPVPEDVPVTEREWGWVIVRQTVSTGQRWFIAKAGQYCTRNPEKALVYPQKERAEEVAEQERRDIARGSSDCRVWVEAVPHPGRGGQQ